MGWAIVPVMWQGGPELTDNPDRLRWNERYASRAEGPSFVAPALAIQALELPPPDGPVLDLACGPSGSAVLAATLGRQVTAVDVSDVALGQLAAEAERRGLRDLITLVQADLARWRPPAGPGYALVLCTGYWQRALFGVATAAVAAGGLLGWEAFTLAARRERPHLPAHWCLGAGEPAILLPASFEVISQQDIGPEPATRRRLLARRLR